LLTRHDIRLCPSIALDRWAKLIRQGRRYKSLSAIARTITGTQWNGYRFFGLRGIA